MENMPNTPRSLILSTRLYQVLLALYPSEFRQVYGSHMLQAFRDCSKRSLCESGAVGLLFLWSRMMLDTVKTALEEHTQRGVDMSKSKFVKLSGWALMLGGFTVTLGWLASSRPEYRRLAAQRMSIDHFINVLDTPLIVMGLLLLSLGYIGLFQRYGQATGSFGRFSLGLGALSGAVSAIGAIGVSVNDSEPWWFMFFFGIVFQFLGLALFGIANLRRRALPRWNSLPFLAGIGVPLLAPVSILGLPFIVNLSDEASRQVILVVYLLSLVGLFLLGYLLQSDSQSAETAAALA